MTRSTLLTVTGLAALTLAAPATRADEPAKPSAGKPRLARPAGPRATMAKPPYSVVAPEQLSRAFDATVATTDARQAKLAGAAGQVLGGLDVDVAAAAALDATAVRAGFEAARDGKAWQAFVDRHSRGLGKASAAVSKIDTPANRTILASAAMVPTLPTVRGGAALPGAGETAIRGAQYRPLPEVAGQTEDKGRGRYSESPPPGGSAGSSSTTTTTATATATATATTSTAGAPRTVDGDGVIRINELADFGRSGGTLDPVADAARGNHLATAAGIFGIGTAHNWHARGEAFVVDRPGRYRAEVVLTKDPAFTTDRGTSFRTKLFTVGGYVSTEVQATLQIMDGSRVVCSDVRSIDRRWLLAAGADFRENLRGAWSLACEFDRAATSPTATYVLAVRVDAWAGGGGVGSLNLAQGQLDADVHAWVKAPPR